MKKKIAFLFALAGVAVLFAGCSSLQTADSSKFNGQKITASEYDEQIICSMMKEVGTSIYDTIATLIDEGTFDGARIWTADMSSGYISIAYGDESSVQQVSEELKAEVEQISQAIVSGEIEVETARQ